MAPSPGSGEQLREPGVSRLELRKLSGCRLRRRERGVSRPRLELPGSVARVREMEIRGSWLGRMKLGGSRLTQRGLATPGRMKGARLLQAVTKGLGGFRLIRRQFGISG